MDSLMDLKETDILGADIADHWYYKSKVKAMMRVIGEAVPSKILDVGAGSGFFRDTFYPIPQHKRRGALMSATRAILILAKQGKTFTLGVQ